MKAWTWRALPLALLASFCAMTATPADPPKAANPPTEATVTTSSKTLGPVACEVVRSHLRREYRKQGMSLIESIRTANRVTDEHINGLMPNAEKMTGKAFGAIGDGKIWDDIVAFFKSPAGQELIAALVKLIVELLANVAPAVPNFGHTLTLDLPPPSHVVFT